MDTLILGANNPDIIKLVEDINDYKKTYHILGFLEKNKELHNKNLYGYPVLGGDELLDSDEFKDIGIINNVYGNAELHEKVVNKLLNKFKKSQFPNLIHPSISTRHVEFGIGNTIYENVNFGAKARIDNFNIIYYGSLVAHEATIKDNCLIGANCTIGARSSLGDRVVIASHSVIKNDLSIGNDVFVGLGSVVVNSITKPVKVFGNPARVIPI